MKLRIQNRIILLVNIISIIAILIFSSTNYAIAIETSDISCTNCHDKTMETHIFPRGTCITCHNTDMSRLSLKSGAKIPIEYSDPLCVECHSDIFQAWIVGGHGFKGANCVECHDSHVESYQFVIVSQTSTSLKLILKTLTILGAIIGFAFIFLTVAKKLREK